MDDTHRHQVANPLQPAALQASGLRRHVGERVLLNDISLSIQGGDRIAIVGPTGSGKSLLLRALAMLDPLDAGEIQWQGRTVWGNEIPIFRSQVQYLHQRPALLEGTVEENLRRPFALRVHRDKRFRRDRIIALLKSLGRDESFLLKQQSNLSGGEAQLTALLRAIQLEPYVLLLDEPTSALDAEATHSVEKLIDDWLAEQHDARAVVWVTHDQGQAERIATKLLHIRDGRLSESINEWIH